MGRQRDRFTRNRGSRKTAGAWPAVALVAALATGCAGGDGQLASLDAAGGEGAETHAADPYEATNRELLESNLWTYDSMVEPSVEAYRWALPDVLRQGVSNVIDNLSEPRVFINDLLQGELERAAESLTRFAFNTTIGFGGLFDRASQMGIPPHDEDFGQTLAVHGVEPGPYLVLPLLGPSNPRDALAWVVDLALDPANYLLFPISFGANIVGTTVDRFARDPEQLATLRATSMDFYTTLRDAYLQNRAYEIANGAVDQGPEADPFDELEDNSQDEKTGRDPLEDDLDRLLGEELSLSRALFDEAGFYPASGYPRSTPLAAPPMSRGRSGFNLTGY